MNVNYLHRPRIFIASRMSRSMTVTRFPWRAQSLESSNKVTIKDSADYWSAASALPWSLMSGFFSWHSARTILWKGCLRMRSSVDF